MGIKHHFTAEQEEWLREHYYLVSSYQELTELFNERFETGRKKSQIQDKCTKNLQLKGMPNPTRYGNKDKEQLPIGTIRKSQVGTYIKVLDVPPKQHLSGYSEPYWLPLQKKIYQDVHGEIAPVKWFAFLMETPRILTLITFIASIEKYRPLCQRIIGGRIVGYIL